MTAAFMAAAGGNPGAVFPAMTDVGSLGLEVPLSGTLQVPYPSSVQNGEQLYGFVVVTDGAAPAITVPAGWTSVASTTIGATLLARLFTKKADGTETGNLDVTATASVRAWGVIARSGVVGVVEGGIAGNESASDTSHPLINQTTSGTNRLCIQFLYALGATTFSDATGESSGLDFVKDPHITAINDANGSFCIQSAQALTAATYTGNGNSTLGTATTNKVTIACAIR